MKFKRGMKVKYESDKGWKLGTFIENIRNGHVKILTAENKIASIQRELVKGEFDE